MYIDQQKRNSVNRICIECECLPAKAAKIASSTVATLFLRTTA